MWNNEYEIFKELNRKLKEKGIFLTVICVGGFVLSHYGMRTTLDVEGFYDTSRTLDAIIREVGNTFGINTKDELWLNNSVQNMNPRPPEEICDILYQFSNLKIFMAPLDYVAGMKLESGREQDLEDVAAIIRKCAFQTPEELVLRLQQYGFKRADESLLLEAFGLAYGMDWLEKYFMENQEEILKRL